MAVPKKKTSKSKQGMRRSHAGDNSGDFNFTVDVSAGGAI